MCEHKMSQMISLYNVASSILTEGYAFVHLPVFRCHGSVETSSS